MFCAFRPLHEYLLMLMKMYIYGPLVAYIRVILLRTAEGWEMQCCDPRDLSVLLSVVAFVGGRRGVVSA